MKQLLWWLRRRGQILVFGLGAAMALAAVAINRTALEPLQAQLRELQREVPRKEAQLAHLDAPAKPLGPEAQLRQFREFFLKAGDPNDQLRRLEAIARKRGLALERADYRLNKAAADKGLDRYQVVVPLRGAYPQVRDFMMTALSELPTMALDQVQLQRKDIADTTVDAQVTLTFFVARP